MNRSSHLLRWTQRVLFLAVGLGWLTALSLGLGAWLDPGRTGPVVPPLVLVVVAAVATIGTGRVLRRPTLPARLAVAIVGLLIGLAVGASVAASSSSATTWADFWRIWMATSFGFRVIAAGLVAVLAWWRGIVTARSSLNLDDVMGASRNATLVLVVVFLLNALAGATNAVPVAPLVATTLVVLFASLVGIPLARVRDVATSERNAEQDALGVNRYWLGTLLGAVAVLLVVAIFLAVVLTFDRLDKVLALLGAPLGAILNVVFYVVVVPVAYLLQLLFDLFQGLLRPGKPLPRSTALNGGWLQNLHQQAGGAGGASPTLVFVVEIVGALLIGGIVVLLLTRAARRYADALEADEVVEERDFVLSWGDLRTVIRDWLRRLWGRRKVRLVRRASANEPVATPAFSRAADPRALYRELLRLGARLGKARAPSETPREYQQDLVKLAPLSEGEAEIEALTEVYAAARYASAPPEDARVEAARVALERLRELANRSGSPPTSE